MEAYYYWQLVAKRLARPRDELLDVLVAAWKDGRIGDRELLGYMAGFVAAGTYTTGTSLVNGFSLLSEFGLLEDVHTRLDDEQGMRRVVEEVLRFGTPFPVKPLFVAKDATFGDLVVPAGSVLSVWSNGGVEQSDPGVLDPARWPNRHVTGSTTASGAELARLETRILLQEGLRRLTDLRLDETKPFERYAGIVDGVTEAMFTFDQEPAEHVARTGSH